MYRTSTEAGSGRPNDSKKQNKQTKKTTGEHNSASVRHHLTSELRPKQPTRNDACCRT